MLDVLSASSVEPLPSWQRVWTLTRMLLSLDAMERGHADSSDWKFVSDAVNMLETLIGMGVCVDDGGLLEAAHEAMGEAGSRYTERGGSMQLIGDEVQTMRAVLEDYGTALDTLSARTMITAHRRCEARIQTLLKQQPKKRKAKK